LRHVLRVLRVMRELSVLRVVARSIEVAAGVLTCSNTPRRPRERRLREL
jgi:hypothetical protein